MFFYIFCYLDLQNFICIHSILSVLLSYFFIDLAIFCDWLHLYTARRLYPPGSLFPRGIYKFKHNCVFKTCTHNLFSRFTNFFLPTFKYLQYHLSNLSLLYIIQVPILSGNIIKNIRGEWCTLKLCNLFWKSI